MPVLIEGVSVLMRKGSIHERYIGGYGKFLFDLNGYVNFISSNQLLCVEYKNHEEARALLQMLADRGLRIALINEENTQNTDAVLVDQVFGASIRVWWLDLIPLVRPRVGNTAGNRKASVKEPLKENILIAATYEELDEKEELRIKNWDRAEIAYPRDWEYERSKSLDLEFIRMAENRSFRNH
ncbi:hypothetical protein [Polynucleobacter sp. MG-6-Vaara-E2]|uniref:hypothetical protein n=1 Tax=Polynucleobacter sp. MG-6-Vaara-E2 TaxID=2576932 RepID=UPI001BFCE6E5|nr:hypothetical protein [Polynucleobacter sp. MG-6-Vaara-E2]QWD96260.1 hypothetical protein ICV38_08340 [Polynucleobacter sp. MG-6-Vaara-E2]